MEYKRSNLTFNLLKYIDYLKCTIETHVEGYPINDHIVQLIEYMTNDKIESKNYVIAGDLISGLKTLEHQNIFDTVQRKLKYLQDNIHQRGESLDKDLANTYDIAE